MRATRATGEVARVAAGGGARERGIGLHTKTALARKLRRNLTDAERLLWSRLRRRQINGMRFRRQEPIGPYVVDFVCREVDLIVELDGGQHSETEASDTARTQFFQKANYRVLRFWNNDVMQNTDGVLAAIAEALGPR